MSGKPSKLDALKDPNYDLARELYVGLATHLYTAPSSPEHKKPEPKALAALCFRLAEAFETASRETPMMKEAMAAASKAAVKLDDIDMSGVFQDLTKR